MKVTLPEPPPDLDTGKGKGLHKAVRKSFKSLRKAILIDDL